MEVIAFGEILYDVFSDGARLGGAPLNFAYYARQFGLSTSIISAVGRDVPGTKALKALRKAGIDTSLVARTNKRTGLVTVKLNKGQPMFIIDKNTAWDHIEYPKTVFNQPRMVYFGTLAQRTAGNRRVLEQLLFRKPRHVFFDVNLRQKFWNKKVLVEGLKKSTIVKFNEYEWGTVKRMTRASSPRELMKKYEIEYVIITKGERGAELYNGKKKYLARSPRVKVVDAVGAGDAFSGAFAAGILNGVSVEKTLKKACAVGAYVVTRRGAQNHLPAILKRFGK